MEGFSSINLKNDEITSYVMELVNFLAKYSWIYEIKNTDIFIADVLENIPKEWKEPLHNLTLSELHEVTFGVTKDDWPLSLKSFVYKSVNLGNIRFPELRAHNTHVDSIEIPAFVLKNTPLKKQNEIRHAAGLISIICKKFKCSIVLDVGSGLGYLDQVLHHNFGLSCIGLDSGVDKTNRANLRLNKGSCTTLVCHETLLVENTEDCLKSLKSLLENVKAKHNASYIKKMSFNCKGCTRNNLNEDFGVVMVGLHCCGKLPHDMMQLFCKISDVKAIVYLGCCYHKMNNKDFPISKAVHHAIDSTRIEYHPDWSPCGYGFRLGAQCTRASWAKKTATMHLSQEKHLMFRAVLEKYMKNDNFPVWHKPKRRIRNSFLSEFQNYSYHMLQNMPWKDSEKLMHIKNLMNLYHQEENALPDIRILMILQMLLQPLWEMIITLDRICFLQENSIQTRTFVLWEDVASPRDIAICGFKT